MFWVRKTIVFVALLYLGALIVMTPSRDGVEANGQAGVAVRLLLLPLVVTVVGFARGRYWSRWVVLAVALAVLPWATVLVLSSGDGGFRTRAAIALIASLLLLLSLLGRGMYDRYEGNARQVDWSGRRMSLVRWTIVFNLASLLNLYLFIAAYRYRVEWHAVIPGLVLGGLIFGLWLLARQKTVGILVVGLSGLLFLPAGAYFVWKEATYLGEATLFAALFLPGILAAGTTLLTFGGPMYRYFRDAA
jgi:hypothetical protein